MPRWRRFPSPSTPLTFKASRSQSCARPMAESATRTSCKDSRCWNCSSFSANRCAIVPACCRLLFPPWGSIQLRMTEPLLGRSINRLEDERFVQGRRALHRRPVRAERASWRRRSLAACACAHCRDRCRCGAPDARRRGRAHRTRSGRRRYRTAAVRGDPYPDGHAAHRPALSRAGARRRSLCRGAHRVRGRGKRRKRRATPPRPSSSTTSPLPPVVSMAEAVLPEAP